MYENFGMDVHGQLLACMRLSIGKGLVLSTWQEISDYLVLVFVSSIRSDEMVWDDLSSYEAGMKLGLEPTRDQLYNTGVAGQCMAGEFCELFFSDAFRTMRDSGSINEAVYGFMQSSVGYIHYNVPMCVAELMALADGRPVTTEMADLLVVSLMAHERAHADQSVAEYPSAQEISALSETITREGWTANNSLTYINQTHEAMADLASFRALVAHRKMWL